VLTEGSCSLFFLPLSHILARVVVLCLVHAGKRIGFLSGPGELPAELAAFRPPKPSSGSASCPTAWPSAPS